MNPLAFKEKLQRLQMQVAEAERLRKDFDAFRQELQSHGHTTKEIIAAYLQETRRQCEKDIQQVQRERQELQKDKAFCQRVFETDRTMLDRGFAERSQGFPTLAKAFGDYIALRDDQIAAWLKHKSHPALRASEVVQEMKSERRTLAQKCKVLEYMLLYYEELFPALADYRETDNPEEIKDQRSDSEEDPAKNWLSAEEYDRLPRVQKLQLALDRYWKRPKSSWQLGRDYERYVGYQHEKDGYEVVYQGIIKGLDDCGRDLICRKAGVTVIVQCKYWARGKVVREKHINQLFGTCVEFWIQQTKGNVSQMELFPEVLKSHRIIPSFVTSTTLSDTATAFAKALGLHVVENFPLKPYPCIKCNVSRVNGERIYHLPFDQQYDTTLVEKERNECYVETVAEAEKRDFRRAFKWHGEN
ncbi:MAG: hypothetical protein A2498_06200 [Lentisphaerae bacterium RIFOXYC12_FULL_60_16]|nr:MAG: hypothetical protein A2498_06200 [Lentisphaerae bacterium RIFOXYC12_FULL_60_16]